MIQALYLHIPFCHTICSYCDFAKMVAPQALMDQYLSALCLELEACHHEWTELKTIYIGGGTPSHLSISQTKVLFETIKKTFPCSQIQEFTIEANPNDITAEKADVWRFYGVNRVSLGVQTTHHSLLRTLNRTHTVEEATKALKTLRDASIEQISCDFIFGLPNQTIADLHADLEWIRHQDFDHLSFYQLILEERTKLYYDVVRKKIALPEEEQIIEMMDILDQKLPQYGYSQYEISNYAKPGKESLHNQVYWKTQEYIGFGMGAHSQVGNRRYHNYRTIKAYIDAIHATKQGMESEDACDLRSESLFLGLRLNQGISQIDWKQRFGLSLTEAYPKLTYYLNQGLLEEFNGTLRTTPRGRRLLNQIESVLIDI